MRYEADPLYACEGITCKMQFGEHRMSTLISDVGQQPGIHRSPFDICVSLYTSFSGLTEVVFQDDVSPC